MSSLPAGVVCRRIGPRWLSLVAGIISTTGALLCLSSLSFLDFYRNNFALVAFYNFLMGIGAGLMIVVASSVVINNFNSTNLGTAAGTVNAFRSVIPGLFIIGYLYVGGTYYDPAYSLARMKRFYIALAVVYVLSNALDAGLYGYYRNASRKQSLMEPGALRRRFESRISETTALIFHTNTAHQQKKWWSNLREPEFHFAIWPSVILMAFKASYVSNISTFARSFEFQEYDYTKVILTVLPFVSALAQPAVGYWSDVHLKAVPRSFFLIPVTVTLCVILLICVFFFDQVYVQGLSAVVTAIACGCVQTLVPPLLVAMFGRDSFPIVWGLCSVAMPMFILIFNAIIAVFYTHHIDEEAGETTCYGIQCYQLHFVIAFILAVISLIFFSLLLHQERKLRVKGPCLKHTPPNVTTDFRGTAAPDQGIEELDEGT